MKTKVSLLPILSFSIMASATSVDELLKSVEERSRQPVAQPTRVEKATKDSKEEGTSREPASYRPKKKKKKTAPVAAPSSAPTPIQPAATKPLDVPTNEAPSPDESKSISWAAVYKGDTWANTAGGAERKTVYIGNFDLKIDANMEKIAKLKGLRAFVYVARCLACA